MVRKLKVFPLNSRIQEYLFSLLLFNIVLEVLAIDKKKKLKYSNWKGRGKTITIYGWHNTLYIKS